MSDDERDRAWAELLHELGSHGTVREVADGRLALTETDGDVVTVLVTREQWAEVFATGGGGDIYFHSLLGPRAADESFIVFHDGDLKLSVREELPPVESILMRQEAERMRRQYDEAIARDPNAQVGWHAVRPDGSKDWHADHADDD